MEHREPRHQEASTECSEGFVVSALGLARADDGRFALKASEVREHVDMKGERSDLQPEQLFERFPDALKLEAEPLLRPAGETTLFTTAGVQRIESLINTEGVLRRNVFAVAQPVIRSQFMDKVKDGTSTAFVNFSVEAVRTSPDEYARLCSGIVDTLVDRGAERSDIRFNFDKIADRWGERKFTKSVLTISVGDVEVGEGVYMHDYPVTENDRIAIADICVGVERMEWAIQKGNYFAGFDQVYATHGAGDRTTAAIDCMRTTALIAGDGVLPAHRDPGYRLRQLSKRFVERNRSLNIDATQVLGASFAYWKKWGFEARVEDRAVIEVVTRENERSMNVRLLALLETAAGKRISMNVNQHPTAFIDQARRSLPPDILEAFNRVITENQL